MDDNWIQTYTGFEFWPLDPRPQDINIYDIAHALSLKCRWTGHCRKFYSVAQHSVMMSYYGPKMEHKRQALFHDAAEAYLPDVSSPIKKELKGFQEIENYLLGMIFEVLGISWPLDPVIHKLDVMMRATEKRDLMSGQLHDRIWCCEGVQTFADEIIPWSPEESEESFLERYYELGGVK